MGLHKVYARAARIGPTIASLHISIRDWPDEPSSMHGLRTAENPEPDQPQIEVAAAPFMASHSLRSAKSGITRSSFSQNSGV